MNKPKIPSLTGLSEEQIDAKIAEILPLMSLDEKIEQMAGKDHKHTIVRGIQEFTDPDTWNTPPNERLKIPQIKFIDGPRGVGKGKATCFPASIARGAAWDADLEKRIGQVMGYEARALDANVVGSPCINVLRHPAWGRAQETYGEDPWHLGVLGSANVVGIQEHVMACTKHFAANSIEKSRFYVDIRMDERTLREIYLPHFKICIDAGSATIMSAYNDLNGYLCAHNKHLLTDILKNEWGFDGFVVSDWVMAVRDATEAANAGLDLEMPAAKNFGVKLKKAVAEGKVSEDTINKAVTRLLKQKLRFIGPNDRAGYGTAKVGGKEFAAIALEAARKGIVLLKNDNATLPLMRENIKTIAVIGKLADKANLGDHGSSDVKPPYAVSPLQGIRGHNPIFEKNRDCVPELPELPINVVYDTGKNLSRAKSIARSADAVIVVAGLTWLNEGEGAYVYGDRKYLGLNKKSVKLIKAVAAENKRSIVVLEGGSAITMPEWKDDVAAILMAWYPGMEGGNAIADVIFGNINPSGKLPIVWPKAAVQLQAFDPKIKTVEYGYYHGYRYYDKLGLEPEFPFGFGLSYTQFKYSNLKLDKTEIGKSGAINVRVDITNTGKMAGDEIVQLYVGYLGSKINRPVKDLKGFTRVSLEPGETKTVSLDLKVEDLAWYNIITNAWEIEKIEYIVRVGSSSRDEDLKLIAIFKVKA